jgi:hypothetical protein
MPKQGCWFYRELRRTRRQQRYPGIGYHGLPKVEVTLCRPRKVIAEVNQYQFVVTIAVRNEAHAVGAVWEHRDDGLRAGHGAAHDFADSHPQASRPWQDRRDDARLRWPCRPLREDVNVTDHDPGQTDHLGRREGGAV